MNQHQFEQRYGQQWQAYDTLLTEIETNRKQASAEDLNTFPVRYRQLCSQYGVAASRHYSPALVDRLHQQILRGHRQLYQRRGVGLRMLVHFLVFLFPHTLRTHCRLFACALSLFLLPAVTMGVLCYAQPIAIYSIMNEQMVAKMEQMYDPVYRDDTQAIKRDAESDFTMFGYYIRHNTSLSFQSYAGGMLFGVGSLFFLLYNGLFLGAVAGHLSHVPYGHVFWPFVCAHGAFELTAIIISSTAGLLLGSRLIKPGRLSRVDALKQIAPESLILAMGAALMLLLAAFLEAFWSAKIFPEATKYSVAAVLWLGVILYFWRVGSGHEA